VSSNEKMQIESKGFMCGSRDPILEFWFHSNISWTVQARNINLAQRRMAESSNV